MMTVSTLSAADFAQLCRHDANLDVIDVRTPAEYREAHLEISQNIPLHRLRPADVLQARGAGSRWPIYVVCQSGGRGRQACEMFRAAGFTDVVNIEGGTIACIDAGIPVVRGQKTISIERQVRIAAGSLILLGALLAWFIHPAFFAISLFVGAGLVFAGVTDTCGMAIVLSRMPWNQGSMPCSTDHGCTST